jgi:hypothetical protein
VRGGLNQISTHLTTYRQPLPARALAEIAAIWVLSDIGYYFALPALNIDRSYNAGSTSVAIYYVFWIGIAAITFWQLYSRWTTPSSRLRTYILWSALFAGCTLFAAYALPMLPPTKWVQPWTPPDVAVATQWYFLPKSFEILFQQLLIAALVLSLSDAKLGLTKISISCAIAFGSMHVLLGLGGMPLGYVVRFVVAAALFGLLFPYLILRVPNGLAYSYMVHWIYYAVTVAMPRIFSSYSG